MYSLSINASGITDLFTHTLTPKSLFYISVSVYFVSSLFLGEIPPSALAMVEHHSLYLLACSIHGTRSQTRHRQRKTLKLNKDNYNIGTKWKQNNRDNIHPSFLSPSISNDLLLLRIRWLGTVHPTPNRHERRQAEPRARNWMTVLEKIVSSTKPHPWWRAGLMGRGKLSKPA